MTDKETIKYGVSRPMKIYGAWAYKIKDDVDYDQPFPPSNANSVGMIPGNKQSLDDININWLKQMIKDGATHLMLAHGDSCVVGERKDIIEHINKLDGVQ